MKTSLMFSGQGSQYYGMYRAWYLGEPGFKAWLDRFASAGSLDIEKCLLNPARGLSKPWERLGETHPFLYATQCAFGLCWREQGLPLNAVLGYSLGELVAAAVAGMLDPLEGLEAACAQAELIEAQCPPAKFVAVLASKRALEELPSFRGRRPTGVQFENNTAWAFGIEEWPRAEAELRQRGISFQVLPVTRGFHSPLLSNAKEPLLRQAASLRLARPDIPVFSCTRANWLGEDTVGAHYQELLEEPIEFPTAVARLEAEGPWRYVDGGPSGTLANFVRYQITSRSPSRVFACHTHTGTRPVGWVPIAAWFEGNDRLGKN